MDYLRHDVRFAFRMLRRSPAFTSAAIVTLALGIGATTALFSTVQATLLRPLPYPGWRDLYSIRTRFTDGNLTSGLLAPVELTRLNTPVIRAAGTVKIDVTLIQQDGTPIQSLAFGVTEGFFDLFRLPMTLGPGFVHDDYVGQPGPPSVVIAHRIWREFFGSNPNIIGSTLRFAEFGARVVGVAHRDLDVPKGTDFWLNIRVPPLSPAHSYESYLRAAPGGRPEALRADLASVMSGLAKDFPGPETNRVFVERSLVNSIVGELGPTLVVVLSATALLLILACVNVTNLFLARAAGRGREMAVRVALGASRGRIVRQLLTESAVVATGGAIVGLLLANAGVRLLLVLGASRLPRLESVTFDLNVLLFALGALIVSGVLVGLAPALHFARTDIKALTAEGGRTASGGRRTYRWLGTMIVAEIALAITLVAGSGWLVRSFNNLQTSRPGFESTGRLAFDLLLPFSRYRDPQQALAFTHGLYDRLRGLGGVVQVGATSGLPMRADRDATPLVQVHGERSDPLGIPVVARQRIVSAGFFDAMGIKMVAGRQFTNDDRLGTALVVIVNQTFVRRYMGAGQPLTMQVSYGFPTVDPRTKSSVVGVVSDVKYASLSADAEPAVYVVDAQRLMNRQTVVVATALADPGGLMASIRAEVKQMDPQLAVEFESVPALVASTISRQQLGRDLMLLFGAIALTLAAVGIYGVIAFASAQRLGEVATRLALGASPSDIFWMMVGQGRALAASGAVLGLLGAYVTGRMASSWLYEVRASDPLILASALASVLVIAAIATVIPAGRAAGVDPARALRVE